MFKSGTLILVGDTLVSLKFTHSNKHAGWRQGPDQRDEERGEGYLPYMSKTDLPLWTLFFLSSISMMTYFHERICSTRG